MVGAATFSAYLEFFHEHLQLAAQLVSLLFEKPALAKGGPHAKHQ
jgi:hypothetical protein